MMMGGWSIKTKTNENIKQKKRKEKETHLCNEMGVINL